MRRKTRVRWCIAVVLKPNTKLPFQYQSDRPFYLEQDGLSGSRGGAKEFRSYLAAERAADRLMETDGNMIRELIIEERRRFS